MLRREFLLTALAGSLAAGCGFRLRGAGQLAQASYSKVYLLGKSRVPQDLANRLEQQFASMQVGVVASLAEAEVVVELLSYKTTASRTAVNQNGDTTGELLKYSLEFVAIRVADEKEVVARELMTLRDRNLNPDNPLTGVREKRTLDREMFGDLAFQLVDQTNRAYLNLAPLPVEEAQ